MYLSKKKLILSLVFLQLCSACSKNNDDKKEEQNQTVNAQTIDADLKLCVDTAINAQMDKAVKESKESKDTKAVNLEKVAADSFAGAAESCGLQGEQKDLYLSYTNVLIGVLPDSVESREIVKGKKVISKSGVIGEVVNVYSNGDVRVRFDGIGTIFIDPKELSLEVYKMRGAYSGKTVISKSGIKGTVLSVYSRGVAFVKWEGIGTQLVNVTEFSIEVTCLENICSGSKVLSKARINGTVLSIYSSGVAFIKWEGIGTQLVNDFSEFIFEIP
ncbi:MAG: hypothetical protein ACOYOK_02275 [Pseudobdellovibrionaceae bacterium]